MPKSPWIFCVRLTLAIAFAASFSTSTARAQQAPSASQPAAPPAENDMAQVGSTFPDVPANHWAYEALQQLAADGYIQGYPDGQFKGNRPMTRYEMAVLTGRVVARITARINQLQQVDQRDIAAMQSLVKGFRTELDQLKSLVADLQKKTDDLTTSQTALKQEADQTKLRLDKGHIGFTIADRPGTTYANMQVFSPQSIGGGTAAAPGGAFLTPGGSSNNLNGPIGNLPAGVSAATTTISFDPGAGNSYPVGPFQHGTEQLTARFWAAGQLDPRWGYYGRVYFERLTDPGPNGQTAQSVAYCTIGATCTNGTTATYQDSGQSNGSMAVYLDAANVSYNSPGGIIGFLGRYVVQQGTYWATPGALLFPGQSITGASIGYWSPDRTIETQFFYGQPGTSSLTLNSAFQSGLAGTCSANIVGLNTGGVQPGYAGLAPYCNTNYQEIGGFGSYYFKGIRTAAMFAADDFIGRIANFWDPAAVACTFGGVATIATSASTCAGPGAALTTVRGVPGGIAGAYLTSQSTWIDSDLGLSTYLGNKETPQFNFQVEWARHLGSDPFTGLAWAGANTYSAQLTFASKGNLSALPPHSPLIGSGDAHSHVALAYFQYMGLNSVGGLDGAIGVNAPNTNLGIPDLNGTMQMGLQYDYWLNENLRFGITGVHLQNIPNVTIPAGNPTAAGCGGCFVKSLNVNQLYFDTYLYNN